jgi:predicted GNAT family N-acyltransferase
MHVRTRVFIDEQHCSADSEIDTDDARSWQWVIYASPSPTNGSPHAASPSPVAVIRLVPPPQLPHALLTHPSDPANEHLPAYDWTHEPCVKLTRVAVLPEYRGHGLGRRLVETALEWAASHAADIDAAAVQLAQTQEDGKGGGVPSGWRGLVLVHAQVDVERMYSGLGFVTDEGLGRWDEEGIEHVGMFRRVEVR